MNYRGRDMYKRFAYRDNDGFSYEKVSMMQIKFSSWLCLQLPELDRATEFYEKMRFEVICRKEDAVESKSGLFRLFLDNGKLSGPIMEFLVSDVQEAKKELLEAGCQIVSWEGEGRRCYMKDPFGFIFNVYEEPNID
jgi:predicted enzyme related to lactoylglutathione lyase